jgi:hypothetical protein
MAEEIECRPFGGQQGTQLSLDPPDHRARADLAAVAYHPGHFEIRIDLDTGLFGTARAGDHPWCPRHERGPAS